MMGIYLRKATEEDCTRIHGIQVKAFAPLLVKYEDFESSPAAESMDQILQRFEQSFTDYYLISNDDALVGVLRVCNFGEKCRLSPICILPEYQGRGFCQQAIFEMEKLYPNAHTWTLETIAQEEKLCYLYEKLGYRTTGKREHIKDGMDLVFYEKNIG